MKSAGWGSICNWRSGGCRNRGCKMQNAKCQMQNGEAAPASTTGSEFEQQFARQYDLSERFLDFADRVVNVVEALPETRVGRRIADQLLRSGTSPLGNYEEACAAESRRDFVHKLGVCLKEVRESRAWLRLSARRKLQPPKRLADLIDEAEQLARIIGQSIATAKGIHKEKHVRRTNPR
jgi:four helix bundle protein